MTRGEWISPGRGGGVSPRPGQKSGLSGVYDVRILRRPGRLHLFESFSLAAGNDLTYQLADDTTVGKESQAAQEPVVGIII
jgi:hypothetical protein